MIESSYLVEGPDSSQLLKFPVEGGTPVRTTLPAHNRGLCLNPGGKRVALTRWTEHPEIWGVAPNRRTAASLAAKAKRNVSPADLKSLRVLAEEGVFKHLLCVCLEPRPRRIATVSILLLAHFLEALWADLYR